jgi:hypothetical protein
VLVMDTDALDFYLDNDRNVNFPTLIQHAAALAISIQPRTENHKKITTVLYKKIRLRCTKLYFYWQTIILITPRPWCLALESMHKLLKSMIISMLSRVAKDLACQLRQR